jgi:hypothetical protein
MGARSSILRTMGRMTWSAALTARQGFDPLPFSSPSPLRANEQRFARSLQFGGEQCERTNKPSTPTFVRLHKPGRETTNTKHQPLSAPSTRPNDRPTLHADRHAPADVMADLTTNPPSPDKSTATQGLHSTLRRSRSCNTRRPDGPLRLRMST